MSLSALKIRGTEKDINRLNTLPKKEKHWNWGGDNVSILALHRRIHRQYGSASNYQCVDCGKKAKDWSNEKEKYTSNVMDYKPRCRSCHVKRDNRLRK